MAGVKMAPYWLVLYDEMYYENLSQYPDYSSWLSVPITSDFYGINLRGKKGWRTSNVQDIIEKGMYVGTCVNDIIVDLWFYDGTEETIDNVHEIWQIDDYVIFVVDCVSGQAICFKTKNLQCYKYRRESNQ